MQVIVVHVVLYVKILQAVQACFPVLHMHFRVLHTYFEDLLTDLGQALTSGEHEHCTVTECSGL